MPRVVNHDKRKERILRQALIVFEENGLKESSLAQIAERCQISRPTLYQYFKDKNEIFYFAVKHFTDLMLAKYIAAAAREELSPAARLELILTMVIDELILEKPLVSALAVFYMETKSNKPGSPFQRHIDRRTIGYRRLLQRLVKEGEACGEFAAQPADKAALLYVFSEFCFIQVAFLGLADRAVLLFFAQAALAALKTNQ